MGSGKGCAILLGRVRETGRTVDGTDSRSLSGDDSCRETDSPASALLPSNTSSVSVSMS